MNTLTALPIPIDDDTAEEFTGPWVVTIVLADRCYGGPEEGGWYYDTFNPHDSEAQALAAKHHATAVYWVHANALAASVALMAACQAANEAERRRSKSSVLSTGIYEPYVFEGLPRSEPVERPRYE